MICMWEQDTEFRDEFVYEDPLDRLAFELVEKSKVRLEVPDRITTDTKSNALADKLFREAMVKCEDGDWKHARKDLNAAMCHAIPDSEMYAKICVQRARCFKKLGQDAECAEDIAEASKTDAGIRLVEREQDIDDFGVDPQEIEDRLRIFPKIEPSLSFAPHRQYYEMANVLAFDHNQSLGRHIVATSQIDVNKVLIAEQAFTSFPADVRNECTICLEKTSNLYPCKKCTYTMFCRRCAATQMAPERDVHAIECDLQKRYGNDYQSVGLAVRTTIMATKLFPTIDALIEFVDNALRPTSLPVPPPITSLRAKYQLILQQHYTKVYLLKTSHGKIVHGVATLLLQTEFFRTRYCTNTRHKNFFLNLFLYHHHIFYQHSDEQPMKCLFNYFMSINHSCMPNVLMIQVRDWAIAISMRPINAREQIVESFITVEQMAKLTSYMQRRKYLRNTFSVRCRCEWCCRKDDPELIAEREAALETFRELPDYKTFIARMGTVMHVLSNQYTEQSDWLYYHFEALLRSMPNCVWSNELHLVQQFFEWHTTNRFKNRTQY